MMPLRFKSDGSVIYLKDRELDMKVKVIIGIKFDEKENCILYTKPFEDDIDPRSDEYWRLTYIENELKILKAIEPADRFRRAQAVKTLCALTKLDQIYKALNDYQILTVMFHMIDDEYNDKAWHKKSLRECFFLLLKKLLGFLKNSNLPHLFIKDMNLFRNMTIGEKKMLVGRVDYMIQNEKEVIRVCKRRALSYKANLVPQIEEVIEELDTIPQGTDDFYLADDDDLGSEFRVQRGD